MSLGRRDEDEYDNDEGLWEEHVGAEVEEDNVDKLFIHVCSPQGVRDIVM